MRSHSPMITCVWMRAQTKPRPPEPALGAFGEKLRKQREQRGLALDAISNTTKIGTPCLRAPENDPINRLPGGVSIKGLYRAIARKGGLVNRGPTPDSPTPFR